MKIVINALSAVSGGGTTYFEGLLPALAKVDTDNEYLLVRAPWQDYLPAAPGPNFRWAVCPIPRRTISRLAFEQGALARLLRRERTDVLYSPAELTTIAAPCAVVVALRNPSAYFLRWRLGFENWRRHMVLGEMARLSAWRADRVIFVSDQSRRAISRKLPIPLSKTDVVYHGISPSFAPSARHGRGAPSPAVTRPYILSVSQIRRAKNYPRLVDAFVARAASELRDYDLVILGAMEDEWTRRRIAETLARSGLESRVHLPGAVGRSALPAWYAGASLFVLPSLLETFGHPLVEAMASGLPVTASSTTSNPEIVGDAGLYFDPRSVDAIGDAMVAVLGDEARAAAMAERSRLRAAHFSWEKTALRTRRTLERAAGRERAQAVEDEAGAEPD